MIKILNYETASKGNIIGFVDIRIENWDLNIRKIRHLQKGEKRWFQFPNFREGEDESKKYICYVNFGSNINNDKFFESVEEKVKLYKLENKISDPEPVDFLNEELPF